MKKTLILFSFFCLSLYAGQENFFVNSQDQALQAIFNEMDQEIGAQELQHNRAQETQSLQSFFPDMETECMEMEMVAPDTNPQGHARSLPPASDEIDQEMGAQEFATPLEQEPNSFPLENDTAQADLELQNIFTEMDEEMGVPEFATALQHNTAQADLELDDLFPEMNQEMEVEDMEMEVVAPDTNPQDHAHSLPPASRAQEKKHKCTQQGCNKTCRTPFHLREHMKTHTRERPHQCPYCEKIFKKNANLTRHIKIHTGERLFKCTLPGCDKTFIELADLNTHHRRTHTGERPFKCTKPGCEKAFTTPSNLKRHINTLHKEIQQ